MPPRCIVLTCGYVMALRWVGKNKTVFSGFFAGPLTGCRSPVKGQVVTLCDPEFGDQVGYEQAYLSMLYGRVDALRVETAARLAVVLREAGGTAQARAERDAAFGENSGRLARLAAAENGLCFGRLDFGDGRRYYIGRIGLLSESVDDDPLLVDWRAPAARPFYAATAAAPEGVHRRRHIVSRERRVLSVDDEVLDGAGPLDGEVLAGQAALLAAVTAGRTGQMHDIVATLQAEQDAIIRCDQHGVLVVQGGPGTGKTAVALHRAAYLLYSRPRLAAQGVLIIGPNAVFLSYIAQVLPGLGETSVLLSTIAELFPGVTADRAEPVATAALKGRAVLAGMLAAAVRERQAPPGSDICFAYGADVLRVSGDACARAAARARADGLPHNQARRVFVDEIIGQLAHQVAEQTRSLAARLEAEVADVLAEADVDRAVRDDLARLTGVLGDDRSHDVVDYEVADARAEGYVDRGVRGDLAGARGDDGSHDMVDAEVADLGRRVRGDLTGVLGERGSHGTVDAEVGGVDRGVRGDLARARGGDGLHDIVDDEDVRDLRRALASDPAVWAAVDALWPALTPQQLLADLFADPDRLAACAPQLSEAERALLVRARGGGWSAADVPLLDEAADLLGVDDLAVRARAAREQAKRIAYAQGVLDIAAGARGGDDGEAVEVLAAGDLLDARQLAGRHQQVEYATVADRAAADRTWTFGHVIVDEAQELSPMAWRLLMRRCPGRSMTLVGDLAQTSDAAGSTSWGETLRPHVGDRWQLARLSVNYRTSAEIMEATVDLLAVLGPDLVAPKSVRRTGIRPWRMSVSAAALPARLIQHITQELAVLDKGRLAVIVPDSRAAELAGAIRAVFPDAAAGPCPDLTARVVVLGVRQAKGLEFDSVVIADPAAILAASPRGRNDLYVALTRATSRLGVLHPGAVPAEIGRAIREREPS